MKDKRHSSVADGPEGPPVTHAGSRALKRYRSRGGAVAYAGKYTRSWTRRHGHRRESRILREFLHSVGKCESLLDLPCGAGRFSELLLDAAGGRIVYADVSGAMLDTARAALGDAAAAVEFRLVDATRESPSETFDLVICIRLLHHLKDPEDLRRALDHLTASAGRAVIVTFASSGTCKGFLRRLKTRLGLRRRGEALLSLAAMEHLLLERSWRIERRRHASWTFSTQTWLLLTPLEA